jgi:heptosyltransferase-1
MKMLVIKPSSLGDVIHALPFLKSVKDTFPDATVDWVISSGLNELVEGNPLINRVHIINKDSWKSPGNIFKTLYEILSLRRALRAEHYDLVVDLQGLLRSGIIAGLASAPKIIGFNDAREGSRFFYDVKIPAAGISHAVDRCLEAARMIGADVKKVEFPIFVNSDIDTRAKQLIGNNDRYIIIAPSARWPSKRWPADNFASLISRLDIQSIIIGSRDDIELADRIKSSATGNAINLCGRTNLKELIALIAGSLAMVSNDSGPVHIAAALNVPCVALFGPTDPEKTGPYGWRTSKKLKVIRVDVPCSPCRKKECADQSCMYNIKVESVLKEVEEYLK